MIRFLGLASIVVTASITGYLITSQLPSWAKSDQAVQYEIQSVSENKILMSKKQLIEQVQILEDDKEATAQKITEVSAVLNYLEKTNQAQSEEALLLKNYVDNLKAGKVSVNVDHFISQRIDQAIQSASEKTGVEAELIRAVMKRESNFDPTVVSKSGAQGLMQLMPGTAKWLDVDNVWDIEQNVLGGAIYLRDQLKAFDGDYRLALAAYNAGPGAVKKYGGIPPYEETQKYVPYVLKYYNAYKEVNLWT